MKVSVFIATSLDGFIARKNGDIDWLMSADNSEGAEDYGYKEFSDSVDCLVMGRNTLETVLRFPEWPYEGMRVIVLSNTIKDVPPRAVGKIELYSDSLQKLLNNLEHEGCKRLYIDGGITIQSFLAEGLITNLTITKIPILLGDGRPLFGNTEQEIKLRHVKTEVYSNGFVKSTYEI